MSRWPSNLASLSRQERTYAVRWIASSFEELNSAPGSGNVRGHHVPSVNQQGRSHRRIDEVQHVILAWSFPSLLSSGYNLDTFKHAENGRYRGPGKPLLVGPFPIPVSNAVIGGSMSTLVPCLERSVELLKVRELQPLGKQFYSRTSNFIHVLKITLPLATVTNGF